MDPFQSGTVQESAIVVNAGQRVKRVRDRIGGINRAKSFGILDRGFWISEGRHLRFRSKVRDPKSKIGLGRVK
jgi:hypothetical protein